MQHTLGKRVIHGKTAAAFAFALTTTLSGCSEVRTENADGEVVVTYEVDEWAVMRMVPALVVAIPGKLDAPPTPPAPADSFAARSAAMGDVSTRTRYRFGPGTPSPGSYAPANGTAVYEGHANIRADQFSADSFAIGKARMEADFGQNTISGRIDRFLDPSDAPLTGTITLSNGTITRTDRSNPYQDDWVAADLQGDLDVNGSTTQVSGRLSGSFREGQDPEPISPAGPGYMTGNINLTTAGQQPLYGGFTASRQ